MAQEGIGHRSPTEQRDISSILMTRVFGKRENMYSLNTIQPLFLELDGILEFLSRVWSRPWTPPDGGRVGLACRRQSL